MGCKKPWYNSANSLFLLQAKESPTYCRWAVDSIRWKAHNLTPDTMIICWGADDKEFLEWLANFPEGCTLEIVEITLGERRDDYTKGHVHARLSNCRLGAHEIRNIVPAYSDDVEALMLWARVHGNLEMFW